MGVKWILNGTAAGRRDFAVTGVLNKKYKSRGRNEAPPNQLLKFNVLGVCFLLLSCIFCAGGYDTIMLSRELKLSVYSIPSLTLENAHFAL